MEALFSILRQSASPATVSAIESLVHEGSDRALCRVNALDFAAKNGLDENTLTSEIREVNMGFNRMARELAKVEEDRAVMLAGISHDLRTPLARLRLEAEMSVVDDEAKRNIAADVDTVAQCA